MIWKEVFIEPGFRLNWVGWICIFMAVLVSLAPGVWILGDNLVRMLAMQGWSLRDVLLHGSTQLTQEINVWVRIAGAVVGCLMLLGVAVRASSSVSGERDRETLDALLTSPLQSHHILFPKLLGSFLAVRWAWLWLGLIWGIGLLTGGLHPLAVPMMAIAWSIYAVALGCLGLWYSTSCATTLRATLNTLTVTGLLGAFHWFLWMFCCPFSSASSFGLHSTLTPPFMLYWLSFSTIEMNTGFNWDFHFYLALIGLIVWLFSAAGLWNLTRTRFRMISARMPYHTPEIFQMPASEFAKYLGQKI
jgi:ABC-type transport system involved in multi-copper enzyme maturation permease subunit